MPELPSYNGNRSVSNSENSYLAPRLTRGI